MDDTRSVFLWTLEGVRNPKLPPMRRSFAIVFAGTATIASMAIAEHRIQNAGRIEAVLMTRPDGWLQVTEAFFGTW